jgi:hypothetical protein
MIHHCYLIFSLPSLFIIYSYSIFLTVIAVAVTYLCIISTYLSSNHLTIDLPMISPKVWLLHYVSWEVQYLHSPLWDPRGLLVYMCIRSHCALFRSGRPLLFKLFILFRSPIDWMGVIHVRESPMPYALSIYDSNADVLQMQADRHTQLMLPKYWGSMAFKCQLHI